MTIPEISYECSVMITRNPLCPSQNVSPILLFNGLVIVTNEGSIDRKYFK